MRHRRDTPGLTPYRLRTIEPGDPHRRGPARHLRPATRRISSSQVAMGVAGAIALALVIAGVIARVIAGGYQAATGAAGVLGMF